MDSLFSMKNRFQKKNKSEIILINNMTSQIKIKTLLKYNTRLIKT